MSKIHSHESTSTKMKGAGDGLKTYARTPVPSSRKFTATRTPIQHNKTELSLKKTIDQMQALQLKQGSMKKSKSVAEITPTKTKGPRPRRPDAGLVLHATPRPLPGEVSETPSRRPNEERRYIELASRRWVLLAWRRNKVNLSKLSESLQRRNDQVLRLEKQVDFLRGLNKNECDNRTKANNELEHVKCILESLRAANENLHNEKTELQDEIIHLQNSLQKNNIDIENIKNDINSKNTYLKRLENEIQKERQLIQKLQDEKTSAGNKIKAQDIAIKLQDEANERMSHTVNNLENELKNAENAKQALTVQFNKLTELYGQEVKKREDAQSELENLKFIKGEMMSKIATLEEKLATMTDDCFTLSTQLKDKLYWVDRVKDFVIVSWAVLQHAAYLMLPAL